MFCTGVLDVAVKAASSAKGGRFRPEKRAFKMHVAIEGCCHGSLSTIYHTIAEYEAHKSRKVDLLLICGDFQALRSEHDFASLAVPPKYHALGSFHEYYSCKKKAPVLTIVIGGNHEASNYMWELYHGGWLAPNIYYLGAAGSVLVNGVRIMGASGIYKGNDYGKGHHEKMPYDNSTMRSAYHIRSYDVAKLMQLGVKDNTVFVSHDWPVTIPRHGDTNGLLRKKPFFRKEVDDNSLGSPPLLGLLRHLQPDHWFAAHLHVKFAALYEHGETSGDGRIEAVKRLGELASGLGGGVGNAGGPSGTIVNDDRVDGSAPANGAFNPDEILVEDEGDAEVDMAATTNPEEILIEDDEFDDPQTAAIQVEATSSARSRIDKPDGIINGASTQDAPLSADAALEIDESADLVEAARRESGPKAASGVIGSTTPSTDSSLPIQPPPSVSTASKASKRVTKFLALDKPGRGRDFMQFMDIPTPSPVSPGKQPKLFFDPHWLAITRAMHPYLSLEIRQAPLPRPHVLDPLIQSELERIQREGLLVPSPKTGKDGEVELVWEKGLVEVARVQQFWPTAPAQGQPGGSPSAWYTNPQTEAFCGMLGIENRINPAPPS